MGYAKGYVPGYGVKHTLHYSFVLVFHECTFHHTLGPGYGEHTLWRRVHNLIPGCIPGYGTSKAQTESEAAGGHPSCEPRVNPRQCSLHVSRCKILFHFNALLWESIIYPSSLYCPPPPAKPTLLQSHCTAIAQRTLPHRPLLVCRTPYNSGDGNIL